MCQDTGEVNQVLSSFICFTGIWALGISDLVSVSLDFPSNSKEDALFHCIASGYSHTDWDNCHDHLRVAPWEDVFEFGPSAVASEFFEWDQVGI